MIQHVLLVSEIVLNVAKKILKNVTPVTMDSTSIMLQLCAKNVVMHVNLANPLKNALLAFQDTILEQERPVT